MIKLISFSSWRMKVHCFNKRFLGSLPALPPVQLPSSSETHLWYVVPNEVKSKELLNEYMEILSPCEKKILSQIQGEEQRKTTLLARALVRTTIARYQINSSISPRSLKFTKNRYGKPEVDWQGVEHWDPPPFHFNISHTSSLVACGVTTSSPVGIDVEQKHRTTKHNVLSLARRYFSEHEVQILSAIPDPQLQQQEFIKLWTLKVTVYMVALNNWVQSYRTDAGPDFFQEAYVKALGKGFSGAPFRTFTIGSLPVTLTSQTSEIVIASSDDPTEQTRNWQFVLLELASSHYVAICTRNTSVAQGNRRLPLNLMVRKTIPFLKDQCVSGTDAVVTSSGLTNWL